MAAATSIAMASPQKVLEHQCLDKQLAKSKTHLPSALLRRLWRLLQRLPAESRRELIQQRFSEQQRLILERWVLTRRSLPNDKAKSDSNASFGESKRGESAAAKRKALARKGGAPIVWPPRRAQYAAKAQKAKARCEEHIPGIMRYYRGQARDCYYAAHSYVGCLQLITKTERRLEVAKSHLAILRFIGSRASAEPPETFEERFRAAVWSAIEEFGADLKAIGLRFVVSIRACGNSKPLRTRPYRIDDVEAALKAWRLLSEARAPQRVAAEGADVPSPLHRGGSWFRLRQAYGEVMSEAGCCPDRIEGKLSAMEAELRGRSELQLQRCNRSEALRQERMERQKRKASKCFSKESGKQQATLAAKLQNEASIEDILKRWTKNCNSAKKRHLRTKDPLHQQHQLFFPERREKRRFTNIAITPIKAKKILGTDLDPLGSSSTGNNNYNSYSKKSNNNNNSGNNNSNSNKSTDAI
eukprot:TRINITY_DN13290_c1_g1_i1.p1 TRINITY_DN13290_c1_g1~~TRINITY_DN13290_c1_g1_i1.p1  ORF type:complete len:471 (+),score=104.53 TRINITY_DN13290_c1_g1_i1:181-1593(+)